MMSDSPHYLLFSEASRDRCSPPTWRFVLQNVESQRRFAATDSEPCDCGERLELLAVVRGLEALDGPARVTLVTKSRYVSRGIKKGLSQWRDNNWCWERFGRSVPVRDHDLWQRVDRALQFHEVHCQAWQFESPAHQELPSLVTETSPRAAHDGAEVNGARDTRYRLDSPHPAPSRPGRRPRIVHPVQRLKRRARGGAAQLSYALRQATQPLREAANVAT